MNKAFCHEKYCSGNVKHAQKDRSVHMQTKLAHSYNNMHAQSSVNVKYMLQYN